MPTVGPLNEHVHTTYDGYARVESVFSNRNHSNNENTALCSRCELAEGPRRKDRGALTAGSGHHGDTQKKNTSRMVPSKGHSRAFCWTSYTTNKVFCTNLGVTPPLHPPPAHAPFQPVSRCTDDQIMRNLLQAKARYIARTRGGTMYAKRLPSDSSTTLLVLLSELTQHTAETSNIQMYRYVQAYRGISLG